MDRLLLITAMLCFSASHVRTLFALVAERLDGLASTVDVRLITFPGIQHDSSRS